MKKLFAMIAVAGMAAGVWAAQNDALLSFSTKGPDKYADGTTVLDGECYALVWTKDGAEFAGLDASGKPVAETDKVVLVAPLAKGGKCPPIVYQIDAATADALAGGTYGVYLLDTRVAGADGTEKPAGTTAGKLTLVNGYGLASDAVKAGTQVASATEQGGADGATGQAVAAGAAAPKDVAQPKIKAIRIEGDKVFLTVENLPGFMRAQGGADLTASETQGAAQATDGGDGDVILVMPKGDKPQGFFKVIRN